MAETFLFSIAENILEKLASHTFQQIGLTWGVERELKKLEETLSTIKAVLLDAEDRQWKNRELSLWLEGLKDVCFDAEDVLDEFAYEALRKQVVTRGSLKTKVHNFFSHSDLKFRFVMGRKIKEIRERLVEISFNKAIFHLTERDVEWQIMTREREMTHSFIQRSEVIGRDVERENIVELLTSRDIDKNFSVVPIVGMGGLGKTTIAKMVYNEERVKRCFELKMWVCVSDDFSLRTLTKSIITSATNFNPSDFSIEELQNFLQDTLRGRKFLLVLDDVWNEEPEKWDKLKELLLDGANGSKIVVTTRSHSVANIMGTAPPCILKGLSDEDCWSLFVKYAFKAGQEEQHPILEKIGKQIVKKCGGVPLAVKSLGNLLFMKTDERDWIHVRDNELWRVGQIREDDILPALKLSYKHLPSYLKQCFTFCSLFPKDYRFKGDELVQLWIAQSYIHSSNENEKLEDIGIRYIKELWSRSFFQDMEEDTDACLTFKMHDIVHDLALLVAQNECTLCSPKCNYFGERVRHVSFPDKDLCNGGVPKFLLDQEKLRTILFPIFGRTFIDTFFVETCTTRFKYLRLLDCKRSSLKELPSSVGTLKHLRTLDLSCNGTIKKLPKSVCKLFNLQTLDLTFCSALEELPRDIGNLMSLRRLCVTTRQTFLQLDKGIGRLTSLQELTFYECVNLRSLGEGMECLTALRTLRISSCQNLESLPSSMKFISAGLEDLNIYYCVKLNLMELDQDDFMFTNLRSLVIYGLPKLEGLPGSLHGAANTLQYLSVGFCNNLKALPEWLQNFTSLQKLEIKYCNQLSALPENMQLPTSLRQLLIRDCPDLRRRCERGTGEDWHKIAHIPNITLKVGIAMFT